MSPGETTRWTLIRRAAAGLAPEQEEFALLYGPVVRSYLGARWRNTRLASEVEDAAQDVLLACLKHDGALSRADPAWPGGFHAFFRGVLAKTALQAERRHARHRDIPPAVAPSLDDLPADDPGLSTIFGRALAEALLREPERLPNQYRQVGKEFREALLEVVAFHHPGTPEEVEAAAERLLANLA
ncbi:MAG: hypothetical protein MUC63_02990, partial [Planctomycetes bacterium]|nr:hypothetical protein [Planctomycetota bacterium]MCU0727722.1 hypothetical protein [Planctomycetota bacterium]